MIIQKTFISLYDYGETILKEEEIILYFIYCFFT